MALVKHSKMLWSPKRVQKQQGGKFGFNQANPLQLRQRLGTG